MILEGLPEQVVSIKIPSGKIVDFPPVSIVSPIFRGACLGISDNWTKLKCLPSQPKEPK